MLNALGFRLLSVGKAARQSPARHPTNRGWTLLAALFFLAATSVSSAQNTAVLTIISGNNQTGLVGTAAAAPLVVELDDPTTGLGIANTLIDWSAAGATVGAAQTMTDNAGRTQNQVTFGANAGPVTVTACEAQSCASVFVQFSLFAATPNLSIASGNNQSGPINTPAANPLVVTLTGNGQPIAGQPVSWQVTQGSATVSSPTTNTGPTGQASVGVTFGNTAGPVTVHASNGTASVDFSLTAQPVPVMSIVSGNFQSGPILTTAPQPLVVRLTSGGQPLSGQTVSWQVTQGSATVTPTSSTTNSLGQASTQVIFGRTPGQIRVHASTPTAAVDFSLTATAASAPLINIVSGNNQSAAPGSGLAQPLVVRVTTTNGAPVGGQSVTWSALSGGGHVASVTTTTAADGTSSNIYTLGPSPGTNTVQASISGGASTTFTEVANAPTTGQLSIGSGDGQTGVAGTTGSPLVVTLLDSSGAPVVGQSVTWSVIQGDATLSATSTTTDANGQASITVQFGPTQGTIVVQASVGNSNVHFTLTDVAPALAAVSGDGQSGNAGSALAHPFVVQVSTQSGTPVPGVNVSWSVLSGGGTLASATTMTDASGRASNVLTLGPQPGPNSAQAQVAGAGSVTFSATANPVVAANSQFSIVSGNGQRLIPLQPSQPLVVRLVTTQGQPISGTTVLWTSSGGSLHDSSTGTDANGQTQNILIPTLPGSYTVSASVAGASAVPTLTFTFDNGVSNLAGLTAPERAVAHAIDVACPALVNTSNRTSQQNDLLQRCSEIVVGAGTQGQRIPDALDAMLNNKVQPQKQLSDAVQTSQFDNLKTRLAALRQGVQGVSLGGLTFDANGKAMPLTMLGDVFRNDPADNNDEVGKDFSRWGFFATGMISRGGFDTNGSRPGFDFHNDAITAGVDYRFSDSFVAGLAYGYNSNNSDIDANLGSIDVNGNSLTAYFTWYHSSDFYVDGSLTLGWLDYNLKRSIIYQIADLNGGTTTVNQVAQASPGGNQTGVSLSLGRDFSHAAWTFTPYLRGNYSHVSLDSFSESIANQSANGAGLGVSVDKRTVNSEVGVIGARASYAVSRSWGVLVPNAVIEWNHEFKTIRKPW